MLSVGAHTNKQIPCQESASELYRPSDRLLSEKLVPTLADRGCHVVSGMDPHGRILCLYNSESLSFVSLPSPSLNIHGYLGMGHEFFLCCNASSLSST
jgi:hypothetical protein